MPRALIALFLIALCSGIAHAQAHPSAYPDYKSVSTYKEPVGAYQWAGRVGLVCGAGATQSIVATKPTVQCGGIFSFPLVELETGVMGPQANRSSVSAYLSVNAWTPLVRPNSALGTKFLPIITGGYTRLFETGHALDYGVGFAHAMKDRRSIEFDARDYYTFANPSQHNVVFRVSWLLGTPWTE